ncbi:SRPBCC domain-containing protein [Kribbella sp. NPDC056345]|uniref:SRPBCC family protein n=1 Tax=Kribbella sp. NPDC056345 TaxID=3345789 RepID=UPI0035DA2F58
MTKIVVTVAAPVDAVWDALRDKEKIRHWHGWEFEGPQGGLEQEIDLIYFTEVAEAGTTLTIGNGDVFAVEPVEGGSRITLTRAPKGTNPDWDQYYDDVTEGWITFLHQLQFALERHPGEPRRTLFYSGTGPVNPITELGLPAAEVDLPDGRTKASPFYTSEHQTGVAVDAWGNGLLVLSHIPPGDLHPEGATMAILSLYGEVDRDELDSRWKAWWSERYPKSVEMYG